MSIVPRPELPPLSLSLSLSAPADRRPLPPFAFSAGPRQIQLTSRGNLFFERRYFRDPKDSSQGQDEKYRVEYREYAAVVGKR